MNLVVNIEKRLRDFTLCANFRTILKSTGRRSQIFCAPASAV